MALFRHLAIGSATLAVAMAFAGMAKAECAPFPKVQWWSNLSHASVKKYVEKKRKGDWYAYLDKWENQFKKLEDIYSRGGSVLVTKDKIKLSDDRLKEYVENIRQRVEVTRCLADAQTIRVGGGSGDEIALKINAWCDAKTAIFQVFNEGQPWPKTGQISIFRIDGKKPITKRRLRLTAGQRMSFKISAEKSKAGEVGLWVDPSWYSRDFQYDAKLDCG